MFYVYLHRFMKQLPSNLCLFRYDEMETDKNICTVSDEESIDSRLSTSRVKSGLEQLFLGISSRAIGRRSELSERLATECLERRSPVSLQNHCRITSRLSHYFGIPCTSRCFCRVMASFLRIMTRPVLTSLGSKSNLPLLASTSCL